MCSREDEADAEGEECGEELQVTKLWCCVASAFHGDCIAARTSCKTSPAARCDLMLLRVGVENNEIEEASAEVEEQASDGDGDGDGDGDDTGKDIGSATPAS